jgi:tripartite-type tricarboxylate transporter receptor subunit TctC
MKLPRRKFLYLAAGAAALPAVSRGARAQSYPTRPVTLIVFVPAGGYAVSGWLGVGAPRGTPGEVVDRLNKEINAVLTDPAMMARFADLGSEPPSRLPSDRVLSERGNESEP